MGEGQSIVDDCDDGVLWRGCRQRLSDESSRARVERIACGRAKLDPFQRARDGRKRISDFLAMRMAHHRLKRRLAHDRHAERHVLTRELARDRLVDRRYLDELHQPGVPFDPLRKIRSRSGQFEQNAKPFARKIGEFGGDGPFHVRRDRLSVVVVGHDKYPGAGSGGRPFGDCFIPEPFENVGLGRGR